MSKKIRSVFFLFLMLFMVPTESFGASNQFGETGLLSIATGETVGSGNLCMGIWCGVTSFKNGNTNKIAPFSLTFGMGKDFELSVSYPNILFNDDVDESGRDFTNLGFKSRLIGTNRSAFKFALAGSVRKSVSASTGAPDYTDFEGKVILGARSKYFKLHLTTGTVMLDDERNEDDEIFAGAALDFSFHRRFRTFVEGEWRSSRTENGEDVTTVTPGVQIFLTPYLTFTGGVDFYLSDTGAEWRALAGLSTCGGIGEYVVPVPKPPKPIIAADEGGRTKPPVPILPKMIEARRKRIENESLAEISLLDTPTVSGAEGLSPVSRYEVPIAEGEEEIVLPPVSMTSAELTKPSILPPVTGPPIPEGLPATDLEGVTKGKAVRKFRIPELMFDFNKWTLRPETAEAIALIAQEILRENKSLLLKIEGHTDNIGSEYYNEKLSLQRASAVAEAIIEGYGISPKRVFIEGYGESKPIASNATPEGRRKNRRVDIILVSPESLIQQ